MNKTKLNIGELKAHFSEVMEMVKKGHQITILFGKQKKAIAEIIPTSPKKTKLKLGALEGKAFVEIGPDYKMTEDEFLNS